MMPEDKPKVEVVLVSGTWPTESTGAEIATHSMLRVLVERFPRVHLFGPGQEQFDGADEWAGMKIRWIPLPLVRGPLWLRFLKSLVSPDPAITVRFRAAAATFRKEAAKIVSQSSERGNAVAIIYDDLPSSCFMSDIRHHFPQIVQIVRSHNILVKGFAGLDKQGAVPARMAWRMELAKIRRFEKRVCTMSDLFWAITSADAADYINLLGITPDGVFGVSLNGQSYAAVEPGDAHTVVHVGSADLRKGKGLRAFVEHAWPAVRDQFPKARLVLGGRGTERFADESRNIAGLGFVDDDRDVLGQGLISINPQQIGAGIQLKSVVAMLAGKAIVSTPMGIEGVEGKDGEHFVVAEGVDAMAKHIVALMRNPKQADEIARKARETTGQAYSHERLKESTNSLLDAVIRKSIEKRKEGRL